MGRWVERLTDRLFGAAISKAVEQRVRTKMAEARRGLMDRHQYYARDGQEAESPVDELLDRYALQPTLRGACDKVAKIICGCQWSISLVDGAAEVPEQRNYLEDLFDHPNGREPFSNLLFEMVVRMKVVGECFVEWIYPDVASVEAARPVVTKALLTQLLSQERARTKGAPLTTERAKALRTAAVKAADDAIQRRKSLPVGFRVLQGTVNPVVNEHGDVADPERAFVQIVATGKKASFALRDVLWIKGPNPLGGSHALAPFESLRYTDDIDQSVQVYKKAFLDNRSKPDGILAIKNPAPGEIDRVQLELESQHKGPENAGRTYVVGVQGEGGADYKELGSRPADVEDPTEKEWRREQALAVLNVPGGQLGFTSEVNRSNMEQQNKALLEQEVQPLVDLIADAFNLWMRSVGIEAYVLVFSQADLRTEREKLEMDRLRLEQGQETLNDYLERMVGAKARVPDGDFRMFQTKQGTMLFWKDGSRPPMLLTARGAVPLFAPAADPLAQPVTDPAVQDDAQKTARKQLVAQLRDLRATAANGVGAERS